MQFADADSVGGMGKASGSHTSKGLAHPGSSQFPPTLVSSPKGLAPKKPEQGVLVPNPAQRGQDIVFQSGRHLSGRHLSPWPTPSRKRQMVEALGGFSRVPFLLFSSQFHQPAPRRVVLPAFPAHG